MFSGHQLVLGPAQGVQLASSDPAVLAVDPTNTFFRVVGGGAGRLAQVRGLMLKEVANMNIALLVKWSICLGIC